MFAYQMNVTSWAAQTGFIQIHPPIVPVGAMVSSGVGSYYRTGGSAYDGVVRIEIYNNEIILGYNTDASNAVIWEASASVILTGQIEYQIG